MGLPTAAQQATQDVTRPTVVLPLERTAYFIGEDLPIAVSHPQPPYQFELVDADRRVAVSYQGSAAALRLETARLAAGPYQVRIDGQPSGITLELASPLRTSCAALTDETLPEPKTPEEGARLRQILQETGINAVMADGVAEVGRCAAQDYLAPTGTMVFFNPYTRPMSFNPARVYEPELKTFRHRLALCAQANARYPTCGGFMYDWDPVGFLNRKMLLFYWQWGEQEPALRRYLQRSDQAVYDQFTARTGLKPVTTSEYLHYCLSLGRPEFAPAIDLPTHRWIEQLADAYTPLREAERVQLERRIDAWSHYLRGLYEECYAGHNAVLREIIPSLRNTSSVNIDHAPVREGQYTPTAYAPLDFRYVTAWNDQVAGPDYTFQWLFSAGLLDAGSPPVQPTWIGSSLGVVHHLADYPGRFLRMAGHNLAYHGRGLGFALEGFSTVLGGMNGETYWENMKGKAGAEDLIAGREFLQRFAPLNAACAEVRRGGVLYSKSQMARQHLGQGMDTPQFNAFITLARLGYTPRFVTEEEILEGGGLFDDEDVESASWPTILVVVNQSVPLPWPVMEKLKTFVKAGGRIIVDKSSLVELPEAEIVDVAMPYMRPGRPYNWGSPNITDTPHALVHEQRYAELASPMLQALGEEARTVLIPRLGAASKVSTFQLDGGPDATYVVAVDDAIVDNQSNWVRLDEELAPNPRIQAGRVLYDLTKEQFLGPVGPVSCRFHDLTARVYGLLSRRVVSIRLQATQTVVCGEDLRLSVQFVGVGGRPMKAAIPFHLALHRPDGSVAQEFYRATDLDGDFLMAWPVAANEKPGGWSIPVRSLLDGMTATLPVTIQPISDFGFRISDLSEESRPAQSAIRSPQAAIDKRPSAIVVTPLQDSVIFRGIGKMSLPEQDPTLVLPVFDSDHKAQLRSVARVVQTTLGQWGITVEIRENLVLSTYLMAYDPTEAELQENARAERGETIGKIKVTTVNRNDYFGTLSGYIFGKPILLLDLVGVKDNEMAERLEEVGILWPRVSEAFPGPGKAVVQLVKSAFLLGVDALVIQATDLPGLRAGAEALADLPTDWLTPSVEEARLTLLREFTIGTLPSEFRISDFGFRSDGSAVRNPLTMSARGLQAGRSPQPLSLRFPDRVPPTAAEVKPFAPSPPPIHAIPAEFEPKDFLTYYLVEGRYVRCWSPGGNWNGDCRFSDAVLLKVDAQQGGPFTVSIRGTFRYSDRSPRSQSTWEDLLAIYHATIPQVRRPLTFDVRLDGQPAGRLTALTTGEKEVPVETLPGYATEKPKSVVEGVVTQVSGVVEIPAGTHEVLFIHCNVVDGMMERITLAR